MMASTVSWTCQRKIHWVMPDCQQPPSIASQSYVEIHRFTMIHHGSRNLEIIIYHNHWIMSHKSKKNKNWTVTRTQPRTCGTALPKLQVPTIGSNFPTPYSCCVHVHRSCLGSGGESELSVTFTNQLNPKNQVSESLNKVTRSHLLSVEKSETARPLGLKAQISPRLNT